jgi:3-hydroxyacyl-CoA dehydrogenase
LSYSHIAIEHRLKQRVSAEAAVLTACQLSEVIEKKPIIAKDSAGFLVNRVLSLLNASSAKLEDVVDFTYKDVTGSKIGPLELADRTGRSP